MSSADLRMAQAQLARSFWQRSVAQLALDRGASTPHGAKVKESDPWRPRGGCGLPLPRTAAEIDRAAAARGLAIVAACRPGVAANLALLEGHAELFLGRGD